MTTQEPTKIQDLSERQNIEIEGMHFQPEMAAITGQGLRGVTPLSFPHDSTDSDNNRTGAQVEVDTVSPETQTSAEN